MGFVCHGARVNRTLPRRVVAGLLTVGTAVGLAIGVGTPAASADPSAAQWSQLRQCESSGTYSINTGNGYYGAYQFNLATWRSVGGSGRPDQATPAEQDFRALYLYRMRGWQPWTCARSFSGDADARSGRVPSYAEAAHIGGGGRAPSPTPTPTPTPAPTPRPTPPPVSSTPAWPVATYSFGDCSPSLRTWQLQMNRYGYGFEGNGCYYDKTRTAVLELQRANGIKDSGILGPKTWAAAYSGVAPR